MKISPITQNRNLYFQKSERRKKADDILRETKLEYPSFAPNYAHFYYLCLDKDSKRYPEASKLLKSLFKKHETLVRKPELENYSPENVLETVKEHKFAQCWEQMICAVSILQKHGYDAIPARVGVEMKLKNKETGEIEKETIASLDHDLVLTDMGDEKRVRLGEFYFIDPWLDFVGSHTEAVAKYKTALRINFLKEKCKFLTPFPENPQNYEFSARIGFIPFKLTDENFD